MTSTEDTYVDLDATTAAWVEAAHAASAEIARLTEILDRAIDQIKNTMGDAAEARIGGRPAVSWSWSRPSQRLDRKKLEGDYGPETIARYLVDNQPARPFRLLTKDDT